MGALSHLNVAEICDDIAGATCGRQFAMWGATVVAIEPEEGSELRRAAPVFNVGSEQVSLTWEYLGSNKRSVALDAQAVEFLGKADVVITDWSTSRLARAGIDLEELAHNAIVLVLSSFGGSGPYRDYQATDLVLQALSGFMALNGLPDREPLKAAGTMPTQSVGVNAFIAGLAGLVERDRSGIGQVVEVSAFEAIASLTPLLRAEYSGLDDMRQGSPISGTFMFACVDGYISLNPSASRNWDDLLVALGVDLAALPVGLQGTVTGTVARRFVESRTTSRSAPELFLLLNELRIACGHAKGATALLRDEHLADRGFFAVVDHPRLGKVRFPGPPARMSATPVELPVPAPGIPGEGEKSKHVRKATALRSTQGSMEPPLTGVRVLDLTAAWLGPYATMLLADLGADVIKVESHHRPDVWRGASEPRHAPVSGPPNWASHPVNPKAHPWNVNANFNSVNRNKRAIALDLTTTDGRELLLQLAENADLVLENFTPRVMDNFGLSYERLREVNPRIVMASFSGFGSSGRYRDFRANGATTDTTCGWAALTGYAGGPPTMMGVMEADPTTGLQLAATAMAALVYARETGIGQRIDGSMFETCIGYVGEELLLTEVSGTDTARRGNRHQLMAPHGVFSCLGSDQWVAISVRNDAEWQGLVSVLGDGAGLRSPLFSTAQSRLANVEKLENALGDVTRRLSARQVMEALQGAGVPAGVVQNYTDVLRDPQLNARAWFQPITHPDMGTHRHNGFPWRFTRTPAVVHRHSPRVGEDSETVLRDELQVTPERLANLFQSGVTGTVFARTD